MLNISSVYGVARWIVGLVLMLAGITYGVVSSLTCEGSQGGKPMFYACHPSGGIVVSSIASECISSSIQYNIANVLLGEVVVAFNTISLFSDLLLEGFSPSLRTVSSHKKKAATMLTSVTAILVVNTVVMTSFMVHQDDVGIHAMRMLNIAVSRTTSSDVQKAHCLSPSSQANNLPRLLFVLVCCCSQNEEEGHG